MLSLFLCYKELHKGEVKCYSFCCYYTFQNILIFQSFKKKVFLYYLIWGDFSLDAYDINFSIHFCLHLTVLKHHYICLPSLSFIFLFVFDLSANSRFYSAKMLELICYFINFGLSVFLTACIYSSHNLNLLFIY